MPQRTNDFQRLVTRIQRALAPRGAKVTESAMVDVPGLEGGREIDVLIEGEYGPYKLKIAVEAKDEGRKMDLTKFEAIVGKYTGECRIQVDKVVVVSQRGFARNVYHKAKQLGIELIKLSEAISDTNWANVHNVRAEFHIAPHVCGVQFEPDIPDSNKPGFIDEAHMYCVAHDHDVGTVRQFATRKMRQEMPLDVRKQLNQASRKEGGAYANAKRPLQTTVVRYNGMEYKVTAMNFRVHAVTRTGKVVNTVLRLESSETGTRTIERSHADFGNGHFTEVLRSLESKRISVHMGHHRPVSAQAASKDSGKGRRRSAKSKRRRNLPR